MVLATSSVPVGSISEHVGVGDPFRTGRQALLDGSEKNQGPITTTSCHERHLIINAEGRDGHGTAQS